MPRRWKKGERAAAKARIEIEGEALYQKYKDSYASLPLEPDDVLAHVRAIINFGSTRAENAQMPIHKLYACRSQNG